MSQPNFCYSPNPTIANSEWPTLWRIAGMALSLLLTAELSYAQDDCLGAGDGVANSRLDLDRLIGCFNAQQPVGDHTIAIGRSMVVYADTLTPITLNQPDKKLTILGNQFSITGNRYNHGFIVQGQSAVTFDGVQVTGAMHGIHIAESAGKVDILNASLSNNQNGLPAHGGQVNVESSSADHNQYYGVFVENVSGLTATFKMTDGSASDNGIDGLNLFSVSPDFDARIEGVRFDGNKDDGVEVFHAKGVFLQNVATTRNVNGIRLENAEATIVSSDISENTTGLLISEPESDVTITNSILAHNETGMTAANGTIRLKSSTIAYSTVNGISASIGIDPETPTQLLLSNATVSSNGAGGFGDGIVTGQAKVSIAYSVITGNAGDGVVGDSNTAIYSSVLYDNDKDNAGFSDCAGGGEGLQDLGANFSGDGSCPGFAHTTALDLGPLQDNGCQHTIGPDRLFCVDTHELQPQSEAINAGNCDAVLTAEPSIPETNLDQRGAQRKETCDAGPFETGFVMLAFE